MSRIKCLSSIKSKGLKARLDSLITDGLSEKEQVSKAIKFALDEHKELHTKLNALKKSIGLDVDQYTPFNSTEKIKEIKQVYENQIQEVKKLGQNDTNTAGTVGETDKRTVGGTEKNNTGIGQTSNEVVEQTSSPITLADESFSESGFRQASDFNLNETLSDLTKEATSSKPDVEIDEKVTVENPNDLMKSIMDEGDFLLKSRVKEYTQADINNEIAEVKRLLGDNIHVNKVIGLIKDKAFGQLLRDGTILISDLATLGTGYHEVFHRVSLNLLSDKQRAELYADWRSRNQDRTELSDKQVEEELAEEFREFMLTGAKATTKSETIFQKIVNFIKFALGIEKTTLDKVFQKISDGKYRDKAIRKEANYSPYSVGKVFNKTVQKDLFDSMTVMFLKNLMLNNFTTADIDKVNKGLLSKADTERFDGLYRDVFNSVLAYMDAASKTQSNGEYLKNELIPFITKNRNNIAREHKHFLSKFNISLGDEIGETEETEEEARTKDTLGIMSSIEASSRVSMPSSIRLLIASLPKRQNGEVFYNNLGLPTLSDYKRNTAILHNSLAGISSFPEQVEKIVDLSKTIPEFKGLLHSLGATRAVSTPLNISSEKFDLQRQFRQQFDKSYYTFYIHLYDENNSYLMDANSGTLGDLLKTKWKNSITKNKDSVKIVNGIPVLDKDYFNSKYPEGKVIKDTAKKLIKKYGVELSPTAEYVLDFYYDLGIKFSKPGEVNIELLADKMPVIQKAIEKINVTDIFDDTLNIKGWINEIIAEEISTSLDYSDNQHINSEGKTVYNISLNNYLSIVTNDFKNGIPEHLQWNEETQTGNPMMRNSLWAKKTKDLKVVILEGATVKDESDTGQNTSALSRTDAALQQFTSVMNGVFPFLRAGDKKLEYGFTFKSKPSKENRVDLKTIIDTFKGYLEDELLSSWMLNVEGIGSDLKNYNTKAKDLRVFKGVFTGKLEKQYKSLITSGQTRAEAIKAIDKFVNGKTEPEVRKVLQDWFASKVKQDIAELTNTGIVNKLAKGYSLKGMPNEIVKDYFDSNVVSEAEFNGFVEQFSYNYRVSNFEQTKLFTGDLAFYSDFFKRTGGLTGTGKSHEVGQEVDNWLNENFKREYKDREGNTKIDKTSDGKISTWVFNDVKVNSLYHESWKQGLIAQGFTEEQATKRLKAYIDSYDETDAQGWVTMPEYREMKKRNGSWTDSHEVTYQKILNNERISKKEIVEFGPEKPQNFSPQNYDELYVPTFYKYSIMPLIPQVIKGTQLEDLMHNMLENGVGISTFSSANKVGTKTTSSLYDAEGKINIQDKEAQVTDYKYMKIQLDSSSSKSKVIFGTQFRKIILGNLIGRTFTIGGKLREGKAIVDKFNDLVNRATELERLDLEEKLGFERKGEGYILKNSKFLRDMLATEAFKRNAPDNLVIGIMDVLEESNTKFMETLVNRNKVENILLSIVNNRVIKQKVFGDMRVQATSTGFETKAREQSEVEGTWASSLATLKFYEYDEKGTKAMEIYLPSYFKELFGEDVDVNTIDSRLLELVGFRIPTQGLNSIEIIKVKGFLPEVAGNLVIVPSEGVAKSGWDFDVDKLTLFFPNYKWNAETKRPEYIERKEESEVESTELKLNRIQNAIIKLTRDIASAPENFPSLLNPNSPAIVKKIADELSSIKASPYREDEASTSLDWSKNLEVREANLSGLAGVGQTALHNVHHILGQIANLKVSKKAVTHIHLDHNNTGELVEVTNPKEGDTVFDKNGTKFIFRGYRTKEQTGNGSPRLERTDGSGEIAIPGSNIVLYNRKNNLGQIDLSQIHSAGYNGEVDAPTILDTISAFLNGFVDVAKDPFMKRINATTETNGTYFYLLRAGVPLRQAVMFMNQPIITEYLDELKKSNSLHLKAMGETKFPTEVQAIVIDRFSHAGMKAYDMKDEAALSSYKKLIETQNLKKWIAGEVNDVKEFNSAQQQILNDYLTYREAGLKLSKLIKATTPDTVGVGSTMTYAQDVLDRMEDVKNDGFFDNIEAFEKETFIGSFLNVADSTVKMYNPLFYTESPEVKNLINGIKRILKYNPDISLDKMEPVLNMAKNDLIAYIVQNTVTGGNKIGAVMPNYFKGERSVPRNVAKIKESNSLLKDNLLFQELYPILSQDEKGEDNLKFFNRRLLPEDANLITEAWQELFDVATTGSKDEKDTAEDIMMFAIFQSGLNNSPISYLQYAPNEQYIPLITRWLDAFQESGNLAGFQHRFVKNRYRSNDLVPKARKTGSYGQSLVNGNTLTVSYDKINVYPYVKTWNKKTKEFDLWKNTGNLGKGGAVLFERIERLGDGHNFTEYSSDISMRVKNKVESINSVDKTKKVTEQESTEATHRDDSGLKVCKK